MIRTIILLIGALLLLVRISCADPIQIVAFGGSNTYGKNLSRLEAYPAQLEVMLKSAGYDVIIKNEGTNGQTTADELRKIDSSIPNGTRIVIFQPGGNDRQASKKNLLGIDPAINTKKNIKTIVKKLIERKISVLFSGTLKKRGFVEEYNIVTIDEINRLAPGDLQSDGQHLTSKGYKIVAATMFPLIKEMLDKILANNAQP